MANYRLYFLNGQGRIVRAVELDCADDTAAAVKARDLAERERWELWDRARLVARSDAPDALGSDKKTPPRGPGPGDP